jgi:hypothetical protein
MVDKQSVIQPTLPANPRRVENCEAFSTTGHHARPPLFTQPNMLTCRGWLATRASQALIAG